MAGFFTKEETSSKSRPDGKTYSCASCGLYKYVLSPRMEPFGNFRHRVLVIGEGPGEIEDRKGKQWQGKVGRRLQREFQRLGIDLFEDCLCINSINCRAINDVGNNRTPTPYEIACCRSRVLQLIETRKPKVIIPLGNPAITCLLGHRWKKDLGGITKWRGWIIPDRDFKAWVCPTFHPSFIERSDGLETETIWEQDLQKALEMIHKPFPEFEDEKKYIEIIDKPQALHLPRDLISIDYETTGLKPHAPGHRVACAAIAYNEKQAQVFVMPQNKKERLPFTRDILANKNILKTAHNIKFEHAWSTIRLRQPVEGWFWDTMLMTHILDNRQGVTGLKFQVYVNFGVIDYDSSISSYLKGKDKKNANAHNRVLELLEIPEKKRELLIYCGLDALYGYKLALIQMELENESTSKN